MDEVLVASQIQDMISLCSEPPVYEEKASVVIDIKNEKSKNGVVNDQSNKEVRWQGVRAVKKRQLLYFPNYDDFNIHKLSEENMELLQLIA